MEDMTQEKAVTLVSSLLKVTPEELESRPLASNSGFYVYQPVRGGSAVLVASDSTVLFANSSITPDEHEEMFNQGKRTDPSLF